MTSTQTSTDLTSLFPHPILDVIQGTPDYTSIATLNLQLNANACSVPSALGGGDHGHLGLTIPATEYNTLTGTTFTIPTHPGPPPAIDATKTPQENSLEHIKYQTNLNQYQQCR